MPACEQLTECRVILTPNLEQVLAGEPVRSSGRFLDPWACVGLETLDQNPEATPCEKLRLAGLSILLQRMSVHGEWERGQGKGVRNQFTL